MKRKIATLVPRDHMLDPRRERSERPVLDHGSGRLQSVSSRRSTSKCLGGWLMPQPDSRNQDVSLHGRPGVAAEMRVIISLTG